MPIKITYTDEKDKEEKLRKLQEQYQQRYNETFGNSKQNSSSNDSNNINTNTQNNINIWDQVKTTASNMLGNTGYGIANGIIGFVQNERRNKTSQNALNLLENAVATTNPIINILNQSKNIGNAMDKTLQKNEAYKNNKSKFEEGKNNLLNKLDQRIQNQEDINNEKIQQNIEETTNLVGKKLVELAPSIGQMLPSAIPGVGTLYSVGSATDSYYDEAKARGMNDEQASRYSQLMGGAEGLTEMIGIGKLVKGGKGIAKGTIKEGFKDLGISVADNFIQEAVTEPISEIVTKGTAGDQYLKNDYRTTEGWKQLGKDMLQSGLDGAITAGIMSGVSAGLGKSVNIYNKLRNNQEITTNEIKSAFDEQRENGIDIDNIAKDKFLDNIQKSQQNTNNISNNTNVDTTSMNLLDSAKAYNLNANDETIKSINQKLNDRGITSRFDETLFKDANGNTRTDVNALWRTTTDENGNIQRNVIFNPKANTNKTMQQVSIHEMLHDMQGTKEFEDLSKLILDKNSTREGYSDARKNLEELYSQVYDKNSKDFQSLINEEEVADTLAQKLGDQEFINSLNKEKPTVFKRIYNWVVDKLNKFTGSKNEKLYWEDVKNKFESAYRQDYQGASNSNRFSIQTDSNGNKFVKIDTNQDIFKGKTLSEQTKIAKQYILDNFRDKGLKLDDENVNVTSKTANEYTHPKNQLPYKTKQAKIKASTELDNMLNISDYQYSSNDDGRHRFAKDGWDYYKTVFEVDGVKFEGLVNIAKSGDKKTFYDVTNIKRISQNRSASDKSFSTSLTNPTNSIPTSNNNVNTTNNNSMQESENNSVEIQRRAIANKLKEKGAQVDNDGNVTLYHITTKENYDKINKDGYFKANDSPIGGMTGEEIGPRSFFSYDKDWVETWRQSNDSKIMEVKVPAEYIRQGAKNEKEIYIEGQLKRRDNGTWTTDKMPTSTFYDRKAVKEYLKKNSTAKPSIEQSGAWQSFLENQIGPTGKGKTVQELKLPTKETFNSKKVDAYNVLYQDNNQISKTNLPISEGGKTRKHYKSIMQSSNTSPEAKAIAKELIGSDTYVPDSNKRQLATADNRIMSNGADNEAVTLATKVKNNDKITADDIAVGERLIEYYSKTGEKEKLQDAIQNVALAGTQAGQTVQAMSLINRQTPQGQAVYLSKVVDRMNKEIEKRTKGKGQQFNLTPEMLDKITNSSKENLEKNIDEVARELAKQVPKTTMEKIDSWRYFSMLANPRTHIRNIIGNLSMASVQRIKNKVAGGLEAIAQKTGMIDKRTKTLKPASKEVKAFAKADVENVLGRLNNESKFDTKNLIQQYQRTFKSNLLENTLGKLYNLNSKALEAEDTFGLKSAYRKAMADYMTANKLTEKDLTAGTREADTKLENARKYAIEQAQEATFHQYSAFASLLNTLENKNKFGKLAMGAIVPFKKTPINVAKTGIDYSPIGIAKSFTTDLYKLKKGDINVNQYIDNLAKGLTGTGITVVGYALAQSGILSASGDDDDQKKQYYQEDRGNQSFSIKIGDKTYSLDWLSPTAIPLFIGAQLNENKKNAGEEKTTEDVLDKISNSLDAMSSAMNPMIEMSMLSGVASAVKSFAQGDAQFFQNLLTNSAKSYVNQFFPTLGGQIAKMVDDTERTTTSTKQNMFAKAVDSTGRQILNKIPFASKLLPAKTDVWGNELKREPNKLYRALQQAVFPWTEKELKSTKVDNSISDLYERTGDNSVLPNTSINKDFTINSEKYRLSSEEYANYKKQYGKTSYDLLNKLTNSSEYKNMTDEQKAKAISEIYSYANEKNKIDYANKNNIKDIKESTTYKTIEQIKQDGGNESDYFKYVGSTLGVDKQDDKMDVLTKMNISDKSKSAIYKSTFGKDDEIYNNVLSKNGIDINEYLKYKTQTFTSDKEDDGTVQGKSITNSKRNKVFDYINSMNISYENRLVLLGQQYKLDSQKRKVLFNYINNTSTTADNKLKIFEKMQGFTVYKDGTVEY